MKRRTSVKGERERAGRGGVKCREAGKGVRDISAKTCVLECYSVADGQRRRLGV